ncbi:MAG: hypothetical protein Ct9H300mP14_08380 [Gammaproteobacteria bacterium]|nr:MAG: hypothetical protein Ct9H300mP14_08380 [Gammaproteobacteria bacterium]
MVTCRKIRCASPVTRSSSALAWDEDAFVAAVEDEDEKAALQHTRGALAAGDAFTIWNVALLAPLWRITTVLDTP